MQSTQCLGCRHYLGAITCDAYPDGIPEPVVTGEHDHTSPYPGDNGILFEPVVSTKAFSPNVGREISKLKPWRRADLEKWQNGLDAGFSEFDKKTQARVRALVKDGTI